jgi:hypothetical protein
LHPSTPKAPGRDRSPTPGIEPIALRNRISAAGCRVVSRAPHASQLSESGPLPDAPPTACSRRCPARIPSLIAGNGDGTDGLALSLTPSPGRRWSNRVRAAALGFRGEAPEAGLHHGVTQDLSGGPDPRDWIHIVAWLRRLQELPSGILRCRNLYVRHLVSFGAARSSSSLKSSRRIFSASSGRPCLNALNAL